MVAGIGGASATAGRFGLKALTPFGKIAFYVTLGFVVLLAVIGAIQGFQEKSWYPFMENTLFRWVGADHVIGKDVEALKDVPQYYPKPGMFSKEWFGNISLFFSTRFIFWINVLLNLWFMFVVIYLLYWLFGSFNTSAVFYNVLVAIVLFALLQIIVGLAYFYINVDVHHESVVLGDMPGNVAVIIPEGREARLNEVLGNSYPFEGVVSLLNHAFFSGDLFSRTNEFEDSLVGRLVMDIPDPGLSINSTDV